MKVEKVNFKNSRDLNLVGDFYNSITDSVVIMAHGFIGDRHEWGKFDEVAETLNEEGYNVLNFDFSGSGESDDDALTVDKEVDDMKCAIHFVEARGLENIALLGMSLGGLVSAKAYDRRIKALVLYSPVTAACPDYTSRKWDEEQIRELDDKGYITKIREEGVRREIIVDKQMMIDRESLNQEELLSRVKCPVLIVHGGADSVVSLEDSISAMRYLPKISKLEVVEGDDHFDEEHYVQFIQPTIAWLGEHFR